MNSCCFFFFFVCVQKIHRIVWACTVCCSEKVFFMCFPFLRYNLSSIIYLLWRYAAKLCAGICRGVWEKPLVSLFSFWTTNQAATSIIYPQITLRVTSHIVTPLKALWAWHISGPLHISFSRNNFSFAKLAGLFYTKTIPQDGMRSNVALAKIRGDEYNWVFIYYVTWHYDIWIIYISLHKPYKKMSLLAGFCAWN